MSKSRPYTVKLMMCVDKILSKENKKIQFFAGLAFSGAFISALFPFPGLTLILCIPFIFFLISDGLSFSELRIVHGVLLLFLISLYYLFELVISHGSYERSIWIRLAYFYGLMFVFILGRATQDPSAFMRGFWSLFLPLSIVSAFLGVVKVIFLFRGYVFGPLDFIYKTAGASYPYGSSLTTDYNTYSSSLLVALIGIFLKYSGSLKIGFNWRAISVVALVLLNIYMCGSRRSYVLLIAMCLFIGFMVFATKNRNIIRRFFIVSVVLIFLVHAASEVMVFSKVGRKYQTILPVGELVDSEIGNIYTYRPQDLGSSASSDHAFGLSSRIQRWKFSSDLLKNENWLFGVGFSYQDKYSCKFSGCEFIDYPHNVFLSEWLLAGVLGLAATILIFISMLREMIKARSEMISSGIFLILLVIIPNSLISGDGVFSVPQVLVAIMIAFLFSSGNSAACKENV